MMMIYPTSGIELKKPADSTGFLNSQIFNAATKPTTAYNPNTSGPGILYHFLFHIIESIRAPTEAPMNINVEVFKNQPLSNTNLSTNGILSFNMNIISPPNPPKNMPSLWRAIHLLIFFIF